MPGASASSTSVSTVAAVNVVGAPRPLNALSPALLLARTAAALPAGVLSSFASSVTDFSAVVDGKVVTSFTVSTVSAVFVVSVGVTVSVSPKASSICLF